MTKKAAILLVLIALMMTACSTKESTKPSETATAPAATPEITAGTNIPEGFPSDIPIVSDAKITSSLKKNSDTEDTYTVTYETKQMFQNVRETYASYLESSGYKDVAKMSTEHNAVLNGSRNDGKSNLSVAVTEIENRFQVTIHYTTKK